MTDEAIVDWTESLHIATNPQMCFASGESKHFDPATARFDPAGPGAAETLQRPRATPACTRRT